jgi:glycosyltransferase involved in cell wall biosynthesis
MNLPPDETPSLAICVASHNTFTQRRVGLERCVQSINEAVRVFLEAFPTAKVEVAWVDDASTDGTWEYVKEHLEVPMVGTKLKVCSHQSYARNLAAKLTDATYLLFCDSDDRYFPNHLIECYRAIRQPDLDGKLPGVVVSGVWIDPGLGIHPDWLPRIAHAIPITKIIHRSAWEFVEGFPVHDLYKVTSTEDQDLMTLLGSVFRVIKVGVETVEYCFYPDSYFARQLEKFRMPPDLAQPTPFERKNFVLHQANHAFLAAKLELLKCKLIHNGWHERLLPFQIAYATKG